MSNLIKLTDGVANVVESDWKLVQLPKVETEARVQAGKVVLFKLTGENTVTTQQIASTDIPETGKIIVPLTVFVERYPEFSARLNSGEIGVWLSTHELLEQLLEVCSDLNSLPIIAIHVERFADGRIFSLGTLLRTRYGFKNELRAIGDVLRDQLFFLKRAGFNSFEIRADRNAQEAIASLNDFSAPYQGTVDEPLPAFRRLERGAK